MAVRTRQQSPRTTSTDDPRLCVVCGHQSGRNSAHGRDSVLCVLHLVRRAAGFRRECRARGLSCRNRSSLVAKSRDFPIGESRAIRKLFRARSLLLGSWECGGQRGDNCDYNWLRLRTLRYSFRRVSSLDFVDSCTHNPTVGGSNICHPAPNPASESAAFTCH